MAVSLLRKKNSSKGFELVIKLVFTLYLDRIMRYKITDKTPKPEKHDPTEKHEIRNSKERQDRISCTDTQLK